MSLYFGEIQTKYALRVVGRTKADVKRVLWEQFKKDLPEEYWPEDFRNFDDVMDYYGGGITKIELDKIFLD